MVGASFAGCTSLQHAGVGADAANFRAFDWLTRRLRQGAALPAGVEVWHDGCCGRCGRRLTDPGSVERGIGPERRGKLGREQGPPPRNACPMPGAGAHLRNEDRGDT